MDAIEEEASMLTWRAWLDRHDGRLFHLPEINAVPECAWPTLNQTFSGMAVGVLPPLDHLLNPDFSYHFGCLVGVWLGIRRGYVMGVELSVMHFSGPGSTTHRSLDGIGFVHVLPAVFQRRAIWCLYDSDVTASTCNYCPYVFKEHEHACLCHCACGGCCGAITESERKRRLVADVHP